MQSNDVEYLYKVLYTIKYIMFVEAQALRENKTIGARRNHLNFVLPDISSSPINEGSGHFTLSGGYKQSGGGLIGYY